MAGVVRDTTGAVLPGVTVEAASPVLIEKMRSAVTDGQGRYTIIELRPGIYTLTFTLSGFRTVRREGVQVEAGASVPINAVLQVGTVEESITVTGETPLVDVQQAGQRRVLDREILDALPTNRTTHSAGVFIPGLKMTGTMVGGVGNTIVQQYLTGRGKSINENTATVDGLDTRLIRGDGQLGYDNYAMAQEVAVESNPASAEVSGGGIRINMIPRDGGNTFGGDVHLSGLDGTWQANNITQALEDAGLRTPDTTAWLYDLIPAYGGPIARDRIWFFGSGRLNRAKLGPAGATYFVNGRPGTEQGYNNTATDNVTLRFTWQASRKNKITTYRDQFVRYQSHFAGNNTTDWATVPEIYGRGRQYSWPTKWTSTVTNRLLIEAGFSYYGYDNTIFEPQEAVLKAEGSPEWYANASRLDLSTLNQTVAGGDDCCFRFVQPSNAYNATVSYVTGSHQVKAGV